MSRKRVNDLRSKVSLINDLEKLPFIIVQKSSKTLQLKPMQLIVHEVILHVRRLKQRIGEPAVRR